MLKINYHVLEEDGKPVSHCFLWNVIFLGFCETQIDQIQRHLKKNFYLKETKSWFNNRNDDLYQQLLFILRKNPLNS